MSERWRESDSFAQAWQAKEWRKLVPLSIDSSQVYGTTLWRSYHCFSHSLPHSLQDGQLIILVRALPIKNKIRILNLDILKTEEDADCTTPLQIVLPKPSPSLTSHPLFPQTTPNTAPAHQFPLLQSHLYSPKLMLDLLPVGFLSRNSETRKDCVEPGENRSGHSHVLKEDSTNLTTDIPRVLHFLLS